MLITLIIIIMSSRGLLSLWRSEDTGKLGWFEKAAPLLSPSDWGCLLLLFPSTGLLCFFSDPITRCGEAPEELPSSLQMVVSAPGDPGSICYSDTLEQLHMLRPKTAPCVQTNNDHHFHLFYYFSGNTI